MSEQQTQDPSDAVGWTEALGEHATNPPTPSVGSDTLVLLGRRWKVSADEARIKAQFEQWVRGNARQAIGEADTMQLPEEAALMRSAYTADFAAGFYTWVGRHVRAARADVPGMKQLLYLMLYRCHPDSSPQPITPELVDDMFDESMAACLHAVMWSLGNFKSSARRNKIREAAASRTTNNGLPTTEQWTTSQSPPTLDEGT